MKKMLFTVIALSIMLVLSGCGGGGSSPPPPPPPIMTSFLSSPAFDGDIQFDPPNVFTVTQGNTPSVLAGIDPVTGSEFRAFLNFYLRGTNGVPGNAFIESAVLDIFIDGILIQPAASTIPIRIELVSFPPQTLLASDFDRIIQPPLKFTTIIPPISRADVGQHVLVDVRSLMVEAQLRGLDNFQIRILEDDGFAYEGRIEINDTTTATAPLLEVTYF